MTNDEEWTVAKEREILDNVSMMELVALLAVSNGEATMEEAGLVAHCSPEILARHKADLSRLFKGVLKYEKHLNEILSGAE